MPHPDPEVAAKVEKLAALRALLIEAMATELKRQYESKDSHLSWYTDCRKPDGTIDFVALEGNPDLGLLADVLLAQVAA